VVVCTGVCWTLVKDNYLSVGQSSLESNQPGATVIPLILSSNKTLLPLFCGKTAYPIYLTIGNIPKYICCKPSHGAQMVIGYIPTTKLEGISNKAAQCHSLANLFHSCMDKILTLICSHGEHSLAMMSSDGTWHRCHPIFAAFVGDYLEQALVTCTFQGCCPKCTVLADQLGEFLHFPTQDFTKAINTFLLADEDTCRFHTASWKDGLKPIYHPSGNTSCS
jgi:hypothetical protein